nr:MAG TPA: hypothetical protein [Caudoviricetes sp.]
MLKITSTQVPPIAFASLYEGDYISVYTDITCR